MTRNICSIEGCGKYVEGHGWCKLHYERWKSNGDPLVTLITYDIEARLLSYGEWDGECFVWRHGSKSGGYGLTKFEGRTQLVTRVVWQLRNGPIPDGMFVCHRCDNPACYRIKHLFLGTHQDNMDDMSAKGRSLKGRQRMYPSGPYLPRETAMTA